MWTAAQLEGISLFVIAPVHEVADKLEEEAKGHPDPEEEEDDEDGWEDGDVGELHFGLGLLFCSVCLGKGGILCVLALGIVDVVCGILLGH